MDQAAENPSYPPLFLTPVSHLDPAPQPTTFQPGPTIRVPLLDLQRLDTDLLSQSCQKLGLFRLTNHGVPPGLSNRLFAFAREILSRPFERKVAELADGAVKYFWGTPAVSLNLKEVNWLEGLHVSVAGLSSPASESEFGEFRNLAIEYCEHMARISRTLFNTLAIDLNLDEGQTTTYLSESNGMFRVYRYPICPNPSSYLGMEAHTDSSVLTILNEDEVGGLQVLSEHTWFNVVPVPGTLIVNLGDLIQVISDDRYNSVKHRVLASSVTERISLGYFVFPQEDSVLRSTVYNPFTLKEFRAQVQEDIMKTGSKVGLKQFRKEMPNLS
ncbi:2-oxoglutarate (2OG) and Fe(II)-dependent oxygenase superfamily protein [Rhynchospora pubera]|uniref:2-oxoglutarate (2OG) and Fe(II)-dependent oxygenase superfamily protein n=1 Tax=Rhynchospora pubera TaxID=906938 RepID=A0AAV8F858_9POAL|nr:2-oxoglutarate (2OG) and Fe(II)-dependent oxygenase superfamily protein [Rhynchospora pubera]